MKNNMMVTAALGACFLLTSTLSAAKNRFVNAADFHTLDCARAIKLIFLFEESSHHYAVGVYKDKFAHNQWHFTFKMPLQESYVDGALSAHDQALKAEYEALFAKAGFNEIYKSGHDIAYDSPLTFFVPGGRGSVKEGRLAHAMVEVVKNERGWGREKHTILSSYNGEARKSLDTDRFPEDLKAYCSLGSSNF